MGDNDVSYNIQIFTDILFHIDDVIREMYETKNIRVEYPVELIAGSLFSKIYEGFRASFLLIEANHIKESAYILRTIIESTFILRYLRIDSDDAISRLGANERIFQTSSLSKVLNLPEMEYVRNSTDMSAFTPTKTEFDKETNIAEWARISGLSELYRYAYSALSTESHSNLKSLKKYYNISESGEILGFKMTSEPDEIERQFITLIRILTLALEDFSDIFAVDMGNVISEINEMVVSVKNVT